MESIINVVAVVAGGRPGGPGRRAEGDRPEQAAHQAQHNRLPPGPPQDGPPAHPGEVHDRITG